MESLESGGPSESPFREGVVLNAEPGPRFDRSASLHALRIESCVAVLGSLGVNRALCLKPGVDVLCSCLTLIQMG